MAEKVTPYKKSKLGKKEQVTKMFDTISGEYDGLNRVITFGTDEKWRKKVVQIVSDTNPVIVLDVATGTGDLAIHLAKSKAQKIIGYDLSQGMLDIGQQKIDKLALTNRIDMVLGDSENMPFEDNFFDAVTVAFGVRNFENLHQGLSEILRVLKPGGTFVVLETSVPSNKLYRFGYNLHTKYMLPLIGRIFSKDKSAYRYLSNSAAAFPYGEAFNNILQKIGFIDIKNHPQTFGVASIYVAKK